MNDQKILRELERELVAKIVSNYVKHNSITVNDLPSVIASVHQSLGNLGKSSPSVEVPTPAVPIRRSIRPEYVVCLECGFRSQMLRRHLRVQHGLEPAAYYARWKLSSDHPITAPAYSARRSAMAKELGLGRRRQFVKGTPRRRSRSKARTVSATS
jgi:predicted transcriptional regulator